MNNAILVNKMNLTTLKSKLFNQVKLLLIYISKLNQIPKSIRRNELLNIYFVKAVLGRQGCPWKVILWIKKCPVICT